MWHRLFFIQRGDIIKRLLAIIMTIVVLVTTSITFPMNNAHAIGPVLKIVGGETLDQIMQGIAYKAGQSFSNETALNNARGRWNMDGYEKAQQYETMLNEEEKARWDKFNQEIKNAPIVPNPSKVGWGKVILSGAAFLTGLDLVYNAYGAFQAGVGGNVEILTYLDGSPEHGGLAGIMFASYKVGSEWYYDLHFTQLDGTVVSRTKSLNPWGQSSLTTYQSHGDTFGAVTTSDGGILTNWLMKNVDTGQPKIDNIKADPSSMGIVNPQPVTHLPVIPNTTVPDLTPVFPQIHPDTVIEIDVPLTPMPLPRPVEVAPLTQEEWEHLIDPNPKPIPPVDPEKPIDPDKPVDPNKPIDPNKDPEKPPYPKPEQQPEITPEYPEETSSTETPSLFGKLWEWLKAILDALFKILSAIIALPFVLLEMLWDFLLDIAKVLFLPSDGYWDKNVDELKKIIWSDEIEDMVNDFENVGSGSGGGFKDIVVSLMGVDGLTVIDADSINSILDNIHKWVRGVIYPLLVLFNINSMYKLIRGTSLVEATRGLANRSKGGE